MPANGRWDLIRRLKVKQHSVSAAQNQRQRITDPAWGFRGTRQHDLALVISLKTLEMQALVCRCVCCIRSVAGV